MPAFDLSLGDQRKPATKIRTQTKGIASHFICTLSLFFSSVGLVLAYAFVQHALRSWKFYVWNDFFLSLQHISISVYLLKCQQSQAALYSASFCSYITFCLYGFVLTAHYINREMAPLGARSISTQVGKGSCSLVPSLTYIDWKRCLITSILLL